MIDREYIDLLLDAGFDNGWVLSGDTLTVWGHNAEPPAPLTRPVAEKPAKPAK